METLFGKAIELMDAGISFAYATIVRSAGSTPRGQGSKMLILEDSIVGTIGGGGSEFEIINEARAADLSKGSATLKTFDMSFKPGDDAALICGGDCDVLTIFVDPSDSDARNVLSAAHDAAVEGKDATLYYIFDEKDPSFAKCCFALFVQGEGLTGDFAGVGRVDRALLENPIRVGIHGEDEPGVIVFSDPISSSGVIYLFGAGHVSKEVALLAVHLGYRVVVFDDREEYANESNFPGCEIVVLDDYERIPSLPIDDRSHILIITRGHAHDRTVLEWAIDKPCHYLGMIGSKSKRDALYDQMRAGGTTDEQIARIHCPIGLSIGARTPAEIAVSIMAEIISCK